MEQELYFLILFIYLFTYGCVVSLLLCVGFSLWWLLLLQSTGSRHAGFSSCGSRALEHRFSSCARALLLHGMWDLPRPGLKPVSPALAGGFLTTAPPGKSQELQFLKKEGKICTPKTWCFYNNETMHYISYTLYKVQILFFSF